MQTITIQDAHEEVTAQFNEYKQHKTTRSHRSLFAEDLTERYFAAHDKMPPTSVLDRLATLILQDELTDATPWKSQRNEYHIQSEREELDYHKKLSAGGVPDTMAMDRVDMRIPTRRQRTPYENAYIDRQAGRKRHDNKRKASE